MKLGRMLAFFTLVCGQPAFAQLDIPPNPVVRPGTPGNFKTRSTGHNLDPGATVEQPAKDAVVRYVTHVVLFEYRMWSNTEGKPLEAKLIAFEDLVVEAPKGTEPKIPSPPNRPTVIKDSKIRLLVNNKPVVVSLEKFSEADREFVRDIDAAIEKKQRK